MRRASYIIDGKPVHGHVSMKKYQIGDFYESDWTGDLFVVTEKFDGKFSTTDGDEYFYQIRPATDEEIAIYNMPVDEKEFMEEFLSKFD